jgi:hypothetical protein
MTAMDDRRAVAAQRRLDQEGAGQPGLIDAGDPYAAAWRAEFTPQIGWQYGVIVDVLPGGYAYRVSAGKQSFLWCSPGGATAGFGVTGGRPLTTYTVGTPVWFVKHGETPSYGTIVHAEPHPSAHTANQPADTIWPFIRSGQRVEAAHQYPIITSQTLGSAGVTPIGNVDGADFSSGRPLDATAVGEWGVMMESGVGVFADPFQAFMRVDESTGVFLFYPDQMLRLAGQNFQQITSLAEVEHLEDEGELAGVVRKTVYPWENRGLWRWNQVTSGWEQAAITSNHGFPAGQGLALNDPLATQSGVGTATSEPEYITQISAARGFEYAGYLGQGGTTLLAAPVQLDWAYPSVPSSARTVPAGWKSQLTDEAGQPLPNAFAPSGRLTVNEEQGPAATPYDVPPNTRADGKAQPGLFEEHKTLAGGYHVRSATRIILAKRASIPVPRPVKRQEDPYGDSPLTGPSNYKANGLNGPTNTHMVRSGLTVPAGGPPQRATGLFDVLSYAFNWENVHPFAYHSRDWSLAQEGAAGSALVNTKVPNFSLLRAQQYLAAPTPTSVDVDHRYGLTPIYENESSVCLLEDGAVLITDGWGSEIRMHSGNIDFRCAGDISMHPGRNLIVWAGHDAVIKAHDCVDITAANGDLRTKAERNSHHLAGNSGCGGFLFEVKAVCPVYAFAGKVGEEVISSGFTVLAPNSEFLVLTRDASIKLEVPLDPQEERGKITLDAGDTSHIRTFSKTFVSKFGLDGSRLHLFAGKSDQYGLPEAGTETANEFSATYTYLGNNLNVFGTGFFWGDLSTAAGLIAGYHVSTVQAAANEYLVAAYTNGTYITQRTTAIETRYDYLVNTYTPAVDGERSYPTGGDDAEFTHRTTTQYRTDSWTFWESRWHTMARLDNQTAILWSEPEVVGLRSAGITRPHPGGRWTASSGYLGQDPGFTNYDAGWVAINRDTLRSTYESAVFPPGRAPMALSAGYTVTVEPRVNT